MLIEGYDVPGIDAVVLARPTWSHAYYYQMVGRSMRYKERGCRPCVVEFATRFVGSNGSDAQPVVSATTGWAPPIGPNWGEGATAHRLQDAVDLGKLADRR
jgi:hypothetical protein